MSRGSNETDRMKANITAQLTRLLTQLSDLEEMKEELEAEEFESSISETMEQIAEFSASLVKMSEGNMSLKRYHHH